MSDKSMRIQAGGGRRRGMAMVGTMLVLLGLMSLMLLGVLSSNTSKGGGSGLMSTTNNALQMTKQREQSSSAFNLADAGIEYGLQWIHALPKPPANATEFTDTVFRLEHDQYACLGDLHKHRWAAARSHSVSIPTRRTLRSITATPKTII